MIDEKRKKEAQQNFAQYLQDGLIKKEKNETAKAMYIKRARQFMLEMKKLLPLFKEL